MMIIRRNSKEYKTIRSVVEKLKNNSARRKWIKLYVVKPGQELKDKIPLGEKQDPEGLFFDLNFTKLIDSFEDKERILHKSDEDNNLFYFGSRPENFPETPFELDKEILNDPGSVTSIPENSPEENHNSKKDKEKSQADREEAERKERERRLRRLQKKFGTDRLIDFTSLDQKWFSQPPMKKEDVLEYYADRRVAEAMKYFVLNRIHSLKLSSDQFYHSLERVPKSIRNKFPEWVQRKKLEAKSYNEPREYFYCGDYDHLLILVEEGCREIHPWLSRYPELDNPDYLVINLNPYEASFQTVVDVGQVTIHVLTNLGLPFYCKLSDKKGLHFYIPLNGKNDFATAKELCGLLSRLIHLNSPKLTSLDLKIARKDKKVYLENSQHQKTGSIIAPYSVIDSGSAALIAAPVKPDEIQSGLTPEDFTSAAVLKRIDQIGDLFFDFTKNEIDTRSTLDRLMDFLDGKRSDY